MLEGIPSAVVAEIEDEHDCAFAYSYPGTVKVEPACSGERTAARGILGLPFFSSVVYRAAPGSDLRRRPPTTFMASLISLGELF